MVGRPAAYKAIAMSGKFHRIPQYNRGSGLP